MHTPEPWPIADSVLHNIQKKNRNFMNRDPSQSQLDHIIQDVTSTTGISQKFKSVAPVVQAHHGLVDLLYLGHRDPYHVPWCRGWAVEERR